MRTAWVARPRGIDTFQLCANKAGMAQIYANFSNTASDELIEALCNLGYCYGSLVLLVDITNHHYEAAYLAIQSPEAEHPSDIEWACNALNRFEAGWTIDAAGRLVSPSPSRLDASQVMDVLIASRNTMQPSLVSVA